MIVVDASVLIAYLDPHDTHHAEAVALVAHATPPLIVHPITAAEVLVAPVRRGVVDAVWADLVAIGVQLDNSPIDPVQLADVRARTGCRMPDCCVLASAAIHRVAVATFDMRLRLHIEPT